MLVTQSCLTLQPLWTAAHQASLSMEFSRQEYWVGLLCLSPEDLPDPGFEPEYPALQADSLPAESLGKPSVGLDKYREVLKQEKSVAGLPVDASQGT